LTSGYSEVYFIFMEVIVNVEYDEEARVWVAQNDVLGLATEADTMEVLTYKLQEMIPELVELNNIEIPRPVAFTLVSRRPTVAFA
jgi:hypothetical protein